MIAQPNKPLSAIVLNRSDKVYLKCENGNIICFSSSSYVSYQFQEYLKMPNGVMMPR